MAEGISFSAITKPCTDAITDMQRRVDRASMYAVREAGRVAKRAAKAEAPVYKGSRSSVRISAVKKARKAGVTLAGEQLGAGQTVEGANTIVAGLLRDSISSSRRLSHVGDTYGVTVAPRGPRVYLYRAKIEAIAGFMAAGYRRALAEAPGIYQRAWARAMER